MNKLDLMMN